MFTNTSCSYYIYEINIPDDADNSLKKMLLYFSESSKGIWMITSEKAKISSSTNCVFRLIGKPRWPSHYLIGRDIFDIFSTTAERNLILTSQEARSQRPLPILCFSGPIRKPRWPPQPLIGWVVFYFFSTTAEWTSTKCDWRQALNILHRVRVFRANL